VGRAVGRLLAHRLIGLEDPLSRFFADVHPGWTEHTIADLLLHRTRLPTATWLSQYGNDPEAVRYGVLTAEPADRPAEPAQYMNRGYLVLGWVVEAVTGGRFADVVAREWWYPLGLADTSFDPLVAGVAPERIAATEDMGGKFGRLRGVVHDENARLLGGVADQAGAFSTLNDLSADADRASPLFTGESGEPGGIPEWTEVARIGSQVTFARDASLLGLLGEKNGEAGDARQG